MTSDSKHATDYSLFTVESATRTLPLVGAIVADASRLYQQFVERRERLDVLRKERPLKAEADLYAEELAEIEKDLEREGRELERYLTELDDLGIASRHAILGAVSFPSMLDGRLVELCWMLGDKEIGHFHDVGGGPDDRQPLTPSSVA